ncbi:hypothetical protein [Nocardioides sp. B-3]|uniref:hypothetical protein n=1 Tax=Nocardioides sp. B-3 TaxID=2895565 RepID=UPI0021528F69|nr:hypothetical protein [Nocardioides sp. B-3]UUZ57659.1 hypothetical protein LP418_14490 [Nocardioides sp. B-3]
MKNSTGPCSSGAGRSRLDDGGDGVGVGPVDVRQRVHRVAIGVRRSDLNPERVIGLGVTVVGEGNHDNGRVVEQVGGGEGRADQRHGGEP